MSETKLQKFIGLFKRIPSPIKILVIYLSCIFIFAWIYTVWGERDFKVETSTIDEIFEKNKMTAFSDFSKVFFLKFKTAPINGRHRGIKITPYQPINLDDHGRLISIRITNIRYDEKLDDQYLNFDATYFFKGKSKFKEEYALQLPASDENTLVVRPLKTYKDTDHTVLGQIYKIFPDRFAKSTVYFDPRRITYEEADTEFYTAEKFEVYKPKSIDEFMKVIDPKGAHFWRMAYFSAITISTIGYGDILPISHWSRFWVTVESFIGVVLLGMFATALYDYSKSWGTRRKNLKRLKQESHEDAPDFDFQDIIVIRMAVKLDEKEFAQLLGVTVPELKELELNKKKPSQQVRRLLQIIQDHFIN